MTEIHTLHPEVHHEIIDDPDLVRSLEETSSHTTDALGRRSLDNYWDDIHALIQTDHLERTRKSEISEEEIERVEDDLEDFADFVTASVLQGEVPYLSEANMSEFRKHLASPHYSLDVAKELIDRLSVYRHEQLSGADIDEHGVRLSLWAEHIHPKHLYELYMSSDDSLSESIKSFLEDDHELEFTFEDVAARYRVFDRIYSYALSHKLPIPDHKSAALVAVLQKLDNPTLKEVADIPEQPELENQRAIDEFNFDIKKTVTTIMSDLLQLPDEMLEDYLMSMVTRLKTMRNDPNQSGRIIHSEKVREEMKRLYDVVMKYGVDTVRRLHESYGMSLLPAYSDRQIATLIKLEQRDAHAIEYLKAGDVTVVFANTIADDNGAIVGGAKAYEKQSGRTLLYEVKQPGDIYRRMTELKRLGILPATLVYTAHGNPGRVGYGDWGGSFSAGADYRYATDDEPANISRIPIRHTALGKLVQDYMQPNRGIDSEDEMIGSKQLILCSCSGDVPVEYLSDEFEGYDSVVEAIASQMPIDEEISVYGADAVMYKKWRNGKVTFHDYSPGQQTDGRNITNRLHKDMMSDGSTVLRRETVSSIPVDRMKDAS